ncbi:MAG: IMP dehydrogenase [Pelagibacteraceae bacterium]|nr:IMP dehydrogenase [Pelagibacteraceae bacterium]
MKKALTYDDINIIPAYSNISSRSNIDLTTQFTKNTEITIPIVSSPMDTVTGYDMALEMMEWGGVGVLHRFNTIEEQSNMMKRLHREWESFFKIGGDEKTLEDVHDNWVSQRVVGAYDKEDISELHEDLEFQRETNLMNRRWKKKPLCGAIGVTDDYLERAQELVTNGCNVLLIDVAHGHHKLVGDAIEKIKKNIQGIEVVAGSIATGKAAEYLCEKGVDGIRTGIGNGSLCETRIRTGVGIPQVTAIIDCVSIADTFGVPVIADGGVRNIGDVCKGLACGADSVMLGSLLSGTKESPGSIEKIGQWPNEQLYKKYRGSASLDSKHDRGEEKNVEGNHKVLPYKGKVKRILKDCRDGIRSSFSYIGANSIDEFHAKVELVEVTNAGGIEAKPHLLNT